jgi:heparosan-N-sulfate-glucuronate 5-epimerase
MMIQKLRDIAYLARDFSSVVRSKDYFHQPPALGNYFADSRCYYYDFRGKANWGGPMEDGVPLCHFPALRQSIHFPIMILQYGLGSMDRWLMEGDENARRQAVDVVRWTVNSLNAQGSLPNYFPRILPQHAFYSDNSGMAQGEALSLLIRAVRHAELDDKMLAAAKDVADRIAENMIRPLEQGGTLYQSEHGIYFSELCRKDRHVVLNGWIFALFGLRDYCDGRPSDRFRHVLDASVETLGREISQYILPSGWSLYDNRGRVTSPFYHRAHMVLLDAQFRLSGHRCLAETLNLLRLADTPVNRWWYTANKIKDKLLDRSRYVTASHSTNDAAHSRAA